MDNSNSEEKKLTFEDHQRVIDFLVRIYKEAMQKVLAEEKADNFQGL